MKVCASEPRAPHRSRPVYFNAPGELRRAVYQVARLYHLRRPAAISQAPHSLALRPRCAASTALSLLSLSGSLWDTLWVRQRDTRASLVMTRV